MMIYAGEKKYHLWAGNFVGFRGASTTPAAGGLPGAAAAAANPHLQR